MRRLEALYPRMKVFDPTPVMCPGPTCLFREGDGFLYRDSDHLSVRGSTFLAQALLRWLSIATPNPPA